jgi:hypothetical protein
MNCICDPQPGRQSSATPTSHAPLSMFPEVDISSGLGIFPLSDALLDMVNIDLLLLLHLHQAILSRSGSWCDLPMTRGRKTSCGCTRIAIESRCVDEVYGAWWPQRLVSNKRPVRIASWGGIKSILC